MLAWECSERFLNWESLLFEESSWVQAPPMLRGLLIERSLLVALFKYFSIIVLNSLF